MEIRTRLREGITILDIQGDIVGSDPEVLRLHQFVLEAIAAGKKKKFSFIWMKSNSWTAQGWVRKTEDKVAGSTRLELATSLFNPWIHPYSPILR